jgi:hypothetical protein
MFFKPCRPNRTVCQVLLALTFAYTCLHVLQVIRIMSYYLRPDSPVSSKLVIIASSASRVIKIVGGCALHYMQMD